MAGNPDVFALLEEMLDSGRTPEEVCRDCPELLPEVRRRWQAFRLVDGSLAALFPDPESPPATDTTVAVPHCADLPQVPGYRVEAVLGCGGMGVVYRAWHLRLRRAVALKMLLAGPCARPEELARFQREAEAVAALSHPNIVQIHDVGDVDGRPYFTMELVEGGNLADRIQGVPQPAQKAAALVATLAEAIHAAHESGIVHRDLKPANILLTTDGTPMVTDFGLARRLEGNGGLTLSGVPMGTPSYMAPEQARGEKRAIGPATDVYALGAILYELLTGRPPFRAESATATLQQVVANEPVPPARLNPRVPRDLETICLKCLNKEPPKRYASAQALAEDLRRFERGEPITARRLRWPGRVVRWARRRPTAAALWVTLPLAALLALALVGGWWWEARQRAANARAVHEHLDGAAHLAELSAWEQARALLNRAEGRLALGSTPEPRLRADRLAADLALGMRLEQIRLHQAPPVDGHSYSVATDQEYEAAFRDARLADGQADPDEVAARIRVSCVHRSIVAALDDWASRTQTPARQAWCLEVARRADTDADSWRDRVRDPKAWQDTAALAELAAAVPVKGQSPSLLVALGRVLEYRGGDAIPLYRRVLEEYPDDFWANMYLGNVLVKRDPKEAIGHFRAALAVRPKSAVMANNLAVGLRAAGRLDEAIACYERALRLNPGYAPAHNNLGLVLRDKGMLDEAQASFERAIEADPKFLGAHMNLGNLLRRKKEAAKAIERYLQAARLGPGDARPHYSLGLILAEQGQIEAAIEHYQKAVQLAPRFFQAHSNLGRLLTEQGRLDEAISHLQAAVTIEPGDNLSHKNLGRALQKKGLPDKALLHLFQSHCLKKEYLAAARLCSDTFTADPKLADDLLAGHRYRAARAAALVGCEGGTDGAGLGEPERARWRGQARDWLRLDLAAWAKRLETANPADRAEVQKALALWREEPDLAGLRDADSLTRLPPAERQESQALWQEVAALLRRAETTR
jgi:serine/threonine-protein kinase